MHIEFAINSTGTACNNGIIAGVCYGRAGGRRKLAGVCVYRSCCGFELAEYGAIKILNLMHDIKLLDVNRFLQSYVANNYVHPEIIKKVKEIYAEDVDFYDRLSKS